MSAIWNMVWHWVSVSCRSVVHGVDAFADRLCNPPGTGRIFATHIAREEAIELANSLCDRVESLYQTLCVSAFAGAGACFLKLFQSVTGAAESPADCGGLPSFVSGVVCLVLGLVLHKTVVLAMGTRVEMISRLAGHHIAQP
jgi:hypothetical protein